VAVTVIGYARRRKPTVVTSDAIGKMAGLTEISASFEALAIVVVLVLAAVVVTTLVQTRRR
jgi:hypothetical protein